MSDTQVSTGNPLKKYFRQPKIYIKLPSKGNFWPEGSLELTETGEIPVFAMTAKDELMIKTPDALMNGESTVQVIQSCVPNVKNAWHCPSIDLDAILIAIRIATYGEKLDVTSVTPVTSEEKNFSLNLINLLDTVQNQTFEEKVNVNEFTFTIRPLNYKEFTETTSKTFEEQRIFQVINNENIDESEKIKIFRQSFNKLTELTVGTLEKSIVSVEVEDQVVTSRDFIQEFISNSDKSIFSALVSHVEEQRDKFKTKPVLIDASQEEIEKGVPETYEVPVMFDQSNFFAQGS